MPDVLAIDDDLAGSASPGYAAEAVSVDGECRSTRFSPEGFPLQMVWSTLAPGVSLEWDPRPGDEVVYIHRGSLDFGDVTCPAESSVLIDAGAAPKLTARENTVLFHFSRQQPEPLAEGGRRGTVVIGPKGTYAAVGDGRDTRFYSQSDDEFSATFFFTGRSDLYRSQPHSHSADEILCITNGAINFGKRRLPAGTAIAVPGDRKYGFVSDEGGFGMVNYRREVSYFSGSDGAPPFREGADAGGLKPVHDRLA